VCGGQREPALTTARTVSRPTRSGSDSGSVDGSSGPSARTGSGDPGDHTPCGAAAEREEVLDAEDICVRTLQGWTACRAGRWCGKEWMTRAPGRMRRGR
jgi:hypothetical protein